MKFLASILITSLFSFSVGAVDTMTNTQTQTSTGTLAPTTTSTATTTTTATTQKAVTTTIKKATAISSGCVKNSAGTWDLRVTDSGGYSYVQGTYDSQSACNNQITMGSYK